MRPLHQIRAFSSVTSVLLLALIFASAADGQIRLRDAASRLADRTPDISGMLQGEPPIATSLEHAKFAVDSLDNFRPQAEFRAITELKSSPEGQFALQPGYFAFQSQSYCLKAGTHGPGGGDGYLYAPPVGAAEEAVVTIVRNSVKNPEISQSDIQTLLWAIIARAKFEDLSASHKATASRLLTPQQLASLNRNALDLVPGPALDRAVSSMPPLVRQAFQAEAQLRRMLVNPATSFAELERVAVLAGTVGMGPGSREVPEGRWSRHPDGYYVRYSPSGYSSTRVEVWVPEGSAAVGKEFDPATHIAVPGNTARQRLMQSARLHQRS
jgi:hypothetical protein